jgi:hypothetical protein
MEVRSGRSILLVDDDRDLREVFRPEPLRGGMPDWLPSDASGPRKMSSRVSIRECSSVIRSDLR